MNKKLLTLLIPLLALPSALRADEHTLIISFCDGSSTTLLLRDKPSATFVNDELWVEAGSFSTTYKRSSIAKFSFGWQDLTPIHAPSPHMMQITYTDNDRVQVHGIPTSSAIGVYSLDGRRLTPSSPLSQAASPSTSPPTLQAPTLLLSTIHKPSKS